VIKKKNILVVEDEADIVELITHHLLREGYNVSAVYTGEDALKFVTKSKPDLILLDLMLPGIDGLEICKILKKDTVTAGIPIIMLTAKSEESDIITGLELGADDYITKPFSMKVLVARVRTVLRREKKNNTFDRNAVIKIHDLLINPGKHQVFLKGKLIDMTFSELRILHFLASKPGWVMTREQIVDAVRGEDYAVTDRAVDVQIVGIRRKLGPKADYIETIRGVGYRFREEA